MELRKLIKNVAALFGVVFIGLTVFFILLAFITKTSFFRQWLRKTIIAHVQEKLDLSLSMGRIEGNLLTGLRVQNLLLQGPEKKENLSLDKFEIKFSPMSLLRGYFTIPLLSLSGLKATVIRTKEGIYRLLPLPGFTSAPSSEKSENFKIPLRGFHLHRLCLQKGSIFFLDYFHKKQREEMIIQKIRADLSFDYSPQKKEYTWRGHINRFSFALLRPYKLTVKNIKGDISHHTGIIKIKNLEIRTHSSFFQFQGKLKGGGTPFFQVKGRFPYVSLEEAQNISPEIHFPHQLQRLTHVKGEVDLFGTLDNVTFSLLLAAEIEKQQCQCLAKGKLDLSDITLPHYQALVSLKRLPVAIWLPEKKKTGLPRSLDLQLRMKGKGIKLKDLSTEFELSFSPFILFDQPVETADISGRFEKESLELNLVKVRCPAGLVQMKGQIDLVSPLPYQLILSFEHIDPAKLQLKGIPASRLDGEIALRGEVGQKFPHNFRASGSLHLFPSRLGERFIDDLLVEGDFEAGKFRLSQGKVNMQGLNLSLEGTISLQEIYLVWNLKKLDFAQAGIKYKSTSLEGKVKGQGKITGNPHDPRFEVNLTATAIQYKTYGFQKLTLEGEGKGISFQNLAFSLKAQASYFSLNELNFMDSFTLEADKEGFRVNWFLHGISPENQRIRARGLLKIPHPRHITAHVDELTFPLDSMIWRNKKPLHLEFDPAVGLKIHSLKIESEQGGTLFLQGEIGWAGKQRMELLITGLPLQTIEKWTGKPAPFFGTLACKALLSGTRNSPEIEGVMKIEKAKWAEFSFDRFSHSFKYRKKNLTIISSLMKREKELLHITGQLPMDLAFVPVENRWSLPGLTVQIKVKDLDLEFLPAIAPFIAQIQGSVSAEGKIYGSLSEPKFEGDVEFANTFFQIKPLLQTFHLEYARIKGNNQGIILEEIDVEGESGVGKISGLVELSGFSIAHIKAGIKMEKWKILYSKETSFIFNGELFATGTPPRLLLSGEVVVPEGKLNLPDFMFGKKDYPEIQIVKQKGDEEIPIRKKPSFFSKNISVTLRLKIPRNFWVNSDQADFELKGDLNLKKTYDQSLILTGNIESIRGIYMFYGKEFTLQKALIQFQGLPMINPILDIKTVYSVGKINIFILISGTKNAPLVSLQSDPPLPQDDIISYLVFGRATEDLNQRESAGLQAEAFALLGRIVATQVLGVFGEKLPVDTIQIRASERGTSSLELGKYVTRDIFVSFGKEFGMEGSEQLRVEYYLYSNLTLETEIRSDERSGVDLIWKKDF